MLVTLTKKFGKLISSKIALDKNLNEYICPNFLLISTFTLQLQFQCIWLLYNTCSLLLIRNIISLSRWSAVDRIWTSMKMSAESWSCKRITSNSIICLRKRKKDAGCVWDFSNSCSFVIIRNFLMNHILQLNVFHKKVKIL